jgi:hypothetical protein
MKHHGLQEKNVLNVDLLLATDHRQNLDHRTDVQDQRNAIDWYWMLAFRVDSHWTMPTDRDDDCCSNENEDDLLRVAVRTIEMWSLNVTVDVYDLFLDLNRQFDDVRLMMAALLRPAALLIDRPCLNYA